MGRVPLYFRQVKKTITDPGGLDGYIVESVARACELLAAFHYEGESLHLKDLVERTGLSYATAFRILYTLQQGGLVERVGDKAYRCNIRPSRSRKYRIGFAFAAHSPGFVQEWSDSIVHVAADEGVELIVLEHGHDDATPLKNAALLIKERVDLAIDYQFVEPVASATASKFVDADIPVIAMGTPRPRTLYYGPNNYVAGVMGGRHLGRWAKRNWQGKADELVLVQTCMESPVTRMRIEGFEVGVRQVLPDLDASRIVRLQSNTLFAHGLEFSYGLESVRKHLRRSGGRRVLLGADWDHAGLGALRALEEAGRSEDSAIVTLGGTPEGRVELRRPGTRLVGDVAFFLDRYGRDVIGLALDVLAKKSVPPAAFAKHVVLTSTNVHHYYPNDSLLNPSS